jgi:hypothetical protein
MEPLGHMIRVCDPMALFHPKLLGSKGGAAGHDGDKDELSPHFDHGFSQRNRPVVSPLIEAGCMDHFVNQNPGGLFLPIDIDAVRAADLRIAAIHMLGSEILAGQRKLALGSRREPGDLPGFFIW